MSLELEVTKFESRMKRLVDHLTKNRDSAFGGCSALTLLPPHSALSDTNPFTKCAIWHNYLYGYELPDTLLVVMVEGEGDVMVTFFGTKRKCSFVQPGLDALSSNLGYKAQTILREKKTAEEEYLPQILEEACGGTGPVALFSKEFVDDEELAAKLTRSLKNFLKEKEIEIVDAAPALSRLLAVKAQDELDLCKKSAVLSNKVLKHFLVAKLETIIDENKTITHETFASEIENCIESPGTIGLKVPEADVEVAYTPIIQSGGKYDLKLSTTSNSDNIKFDVITASMGSKYKGYCSNMARTFLVDPVKKVSDEYETLLALQEKLIDRMRPGVTLSDVYKTAMEFLNKRGEKHLVEALPKSLGFGIGLDFRDSSLLISPKNNGVLKKGMVFYLSLSFQNLKKEDSGEPYVLLLGDVVHVGDDGAELWTKHAKKLSDISYVINDNDGNGSEGSDDGEAENSRRSKRSGGNIDTSKSAADVVKSRRQAADQAAISAAGDREKKQLQILKSRNEMRLRELARAKKNGDGDKEEEAEDLQCYDSTTQYPEGTVGYMVKVDMQKETVIIPFHGIPVPFHVSTIKSVVQPDPDLRAYYLRINFYGAGQSLPKDASSNIKNLVEKYGLHSSFIREVTLRSLSEANLTQAFRQISELRKRYRNRITIDELQSTLVVQDKLQRIKNERISRLSDVTMRPVLSGRKTQGNLEIHANGLRFISNKNETIDILYNNVMHPIFQPCENEIMVLLHFHLKSEIMIGKKKVKDVQFFTEVVDSSLQVDHRSTMYDPDEMDDEQRERQLRKKLNIAFKEFAKKVESTAKKYGHSIEFDVPYRDLGFNGNPHREMVFIQPTLNTLVNVSETPFFCVPIDEIDHVHFERVSFASKAFDMVLVNKNFDKQPWRIDMVNNDNKDSIQDWLTDMEISYTEGPMNLNWKSIMETVKQDDRFYNDTEEDLTTPKEAGWEFLSLVGKDDDESEEEEDESEFSGNEEAQSSSSEEDLESDEYESESSEGGYSDGSLEEEGMDWDEMEKEAAISDKRKNVQDRDEERAQRSKPAKRRKR